MEGFEGVSGGRESRLKDVVPGMVIDARDTEYIWCKSKVVKVVTYSDSLQSLLVHYEVVCSFNQL